MLLYLENNLINFKLFIINFKYLFDSNFVAAEKSLVNKEKEKNNCKTFSLPLSLSTKPIHTINPFCLSTYTYRERK